MADDTSALKKSSPYFSTDLGRSGIYDGVGNDKGEYKIDEKERVQNEPDYDERDQERSQRESGAYKRYISSSKQTYPAENIINGKKVIQDRDRPLDGDGRSTPDSGVYSKNIESSERGQESYNVGNGSDGRNSNENRESGDYSRNIRTHGDNAFMANENQTQWPKSFKTSNYCGRTLETPFENDEDLPVETGAGKTENNTDFSKSKMYTSKRESQDFDDISNRSYVSTKELPLWTKLISDPEITNQYFNQKWPRISLQLPKSLGSDAFSVPKTADTDDCVADSNKEGEHTTRCTAFVIGIGVVIILLVAAAITTITILTKDSEPDSPTFSKINMRLTVNQNYTLDLDDNQSQSYQTFTTTFCKEIDIIFRNSTNGFGSKYDQCSVTNLSRGSVIVKFSLFTISLSDTKAYAADDILNSSLRTNKDNLGSFKVVTGTLTLISIERIQIIPTTTPVTITTSILAETTTTAMTETSTQKVETTPSSANVFTTTLSANFTAETTMTDTETTKVETTTPSANVPTTITTTTETTTQTAETSPTNVPTNTTRTETTSQTAETSPANVPTTNTTTTETTTQIAETSPLNVPTTTTTTTENATETAKTSPANVSITTTTTTETTTQTAKTSPENIPATSTTPETTIPTGEKTSPATTTTNYTETTNEIDTKTAATTTTQLPSETSASATEMTKTTIISNTTSDGLSTIQDTETSLLTHSAETQTTTSLFNNSTVKLLTSTTMTATTTTNAPETTSTSPTVSVSADSSTETTDQQSTNEDVTTGPKASSQTQLTTLHVPLSTTMSNGDLSTTLLSTSPELSTTENAQDPTISPSPRTHSTMTEETTGTSSTKREETTSVSRTTSDLSTSQFSAKMTEVTTEKTTQDTITSNNITSEQTTDSTKTTIIEHTSDTTSVSGTNYISKIETTTTIETSAISTTKRAFTDSPTTSSNNEVSTDKTNEVETVTTTALPIQETTSKLHTSISPQQTSSVEHTEQPLDKTTLSISPMNSTTEINTSIPFTTTTENVATNTTVIEASTPLTPTTENVATDTTLEKISLSTLTDTTVTDNSFTITDISTAEMTTIAPNSTENKTEYVSADMEVTLNTTYSPALNDTSSAEYASFTQGFCSEIDRIYNNETTAFGNDYYGCTVTGISEGSVIVEFRIYCIELPLEQLRSESEMILRKYIGDSIQIGPDKLQVIVVTLINVQIDNPIIITTPPTKAKSTTTAVQCINEKPSSPSLKMHVDQVIDLGFYRSGSENECEAEVGYPPGNLIIEVKYNNSTQFEEIPPIDISYVDNSTIPGNCSNRQILKFGMNYSAAMDNGKIRCRVNHPIFSEIVSDEKDLHLIPRDICACNTVAGIKRGHPSRCDVYVECIQRVYPTGVACPADHCRNSLTGVCSSNCSEVVCREEVPTSFCTTPPPSTTTPAPSAYVSCNSSSALINSGPVNIVCSLNESTSFSSINITFTPAAESSPVLKSQIQANRSVTDTDDNIIVILVENVITITILNASCDTKGIYGVTVDINGDSADAVGILTIVHNPGKPVLTLNADQVINLGFYREGREHTCTGDVGLSINQLIIEIQYYNQTDFQEFPESNIVVIDRRKEPFECPYKETITFGIKFTTEMDNAKIRCRVSGPVDNETQTVEDLALIPRDICSCGMNLARRGHPNRCDVYIECIEANGVMYPIGARCNTGQCRNSLTGICSDDCSVCDEEVPSDFCTTPAPTFTTPAPSPYIHCSDNTTLLNTGPVDLACFLNVTSFSLINITHQITADANSVMIAQIDNNANIHILDYNITFSVKFEINTITITIQIATCSAQGIYRISVDLSEFSIIAQGHIKILSQPGRPIMEQNHQNIQGKGSTFSCTANVGNNPGTIEFVVRKHSDLNDTIVTTEDINFEAGTVQPLTMECNNRQTVKYTPVLTSDWNLTSIKCRVKNEETISVYDESLYSSEYQSIVLIEENYCSADDVEYKIHPRGCNYYVRCVNSNIHSQICSSTLCFNFNMTKPACERCEPCISL